MTTQTIDLKDFGMPVFTGRDRGEKLREKLKLDELQAKSDFMVIVPNETYTLTSSYFLALFGPSVRERLINRNFAPSAHSTRTCSADAG